jgi:uncharacterized protein YidB (DUF937 family)
VKIEAWQKKNDDALEVDKQILDELMDQLGTDQQQIFDRLSKLQSPTINHLTKSTPRSAPH